MSVLEKVHKGFNLLTREQRDRLNLEWLNMDSDYNCVLGQLFGDFDKGVDHFNGNRYDDSPILYLDWAREYGFYVEYDPEENTDLWYEYDKLKNAWVTLLKEERGSK
jgi:hypothetical protein